MKLLEVKRQETPADVEGVRKMVQVYMSQNKKDEAIKVADTAIAKEPDNLALQIVRAQIEKDDKKAAELTLKAVQAITDPFTREERLYEFYTMENNVPEAQKHLEAAEKID